MRSRALLLALAVLAVAVPAAGAIVPNPRPAARNLDSDRRLETVNPRFGCQHASGRVHPGPCHRGDLFVRRIEILDFCGGRTRMHVLSGWRPIVNFLELQQADGVGRRELFFDVRARRNLGRDASVRLIRLHGERPGVCPWPRVLFRFDRGAGGLPPGARRELHSTVFIGNYTNEFRGKEIYVVQYYLDEDDPPSRPSIGRGILLRYVPGADTYRRYQVIVEDQETMSASARERSRIRALIP